MRIGIDLMGSDSTPNVLFEGVLQAACQFDPSHAFAVIATPELIEEFRSKAVALPTSCAKIELFPAAEFIAMGDGPLAAIRQKKDSSLVSGIRLLKKKGIEGFISAGNTGALIAAASLYLPMLPNISRPALLAMLPTNRGFTAVIDVGGNVSCKAHHLVQFAKMGAAAVRSHQLAETPSVGLLNIGVESKKGTSEHRQAYQLLEQLGIESKMIFKGNVEGREVLQGKVDVLVTDGFTGNVLLKSIEGTSAFILNYLWETCQISSKVEVTEMIQKLKTHFNYDEYPGAILCGVDRIVIKCHGNSSSKAFYNGILGLVKLVKNRLLDQFKGQL